MFSSRFWPIAAAAAVVMATSAPAMAQTPLALDLPAQPLENSLRTLAQQGAVQLIYRTDLIKGRAAPALKGSYTVEQALNALLAGSELRVVRNDATTFGIVVGAPETALPAAHIVASAISDGDRINPPTTVGSRTGLSQREIAQTVTVITHDQIASQNMDNVQTALRYASGISTPNVDTSRFRIYSRGFTIDNIQLDGVSIPIVGYMTPSNLAMYDRVEVLKGPAGLFDGVGGAGGALNLVRKRPGTEREMSAAVGFGSYGKFTQEVDVGGPLNEADTLRARAVAALENEDLRQDGTHRRDAQLYGIVEADIARATKLSAGVSYQSMRSKSMQYGYPTYKDGSFLNVDPSTYYGASWNDEAYRYTTVFGELEHKFDSGWTTRFSANYLQTHRDTQFAGLRGAVNPSADTSAYQTSMSGFDAEQTSLDWFGSGPFHLLGRRHTATIGVNYLSQWYPQWGAPGNPRNVTVDLANPVDVAPVSFAANLSKQTTYTNQTSLYGNLRFSLNDPTTLIIGARATWWQTTVKADPNANASAVADSSDRVDAHITPVIGLIYDLNDTYSVYGSYTQIFQPQSVRDASGNLIKPLTGAQYEVGLKGSYLDGRINASIALFDLTQSNRAVADTTNNAITTYFAQGKARSRGVETQLSGELLPGWTVSGGYSFNTSYYLDGGADTGKNAFSAYSPKHLFKFWTQYRLPGAWHRLMLNAGVYVSSEFSSFDGTATVRQPGYATLDLGAQYDVSPTVSVTVTVSNVFNRLYYQSISTTADHNFLGNPRTVMTTLRTRF